MEGRGGKGGMKRKGRNVEELNGRVGKGMGGKERGGREG